MDLSNEKLLINEISSIIKEAKNKVSLQVNNAIIIAYWNIGRLIVEHE